MTSNNFACNCVSSHGKQAVKLPHSRPDGEDSDGITSAMGVVQALTSVFLDDNDKLRCINAGCTQITFLLRPPLYYVCVSLSTSSLHCLKLDPNIRKRIAEILVRLCQNLDFLIPISLCYGKKAKHHPFPTDALPNDNVNLNPPFGPNDNINININTSDQPNVSSQTSPVSDKSNLTVRGTNAPSTSPIESNTSKV